MSDVRLIVLICMPLTIYGYPCQTHELFVNCRERGLINTWIPQHIPGATILDMSRNDIAIIRGNEFQDGGWIWLEKINLSENKIEEFNKFAFNGLKRLSILNLSHNNIEMLPPDLFNGNQGITSLDLSFNPLSSNIYINTPNLQVLDISHCGLTIVPKDLLRSLPVLKRLHLNDNEIKRLSIETFTSMKLTFLYLQGNPIICHEDNSQDVTGWLAEHGIRGTRPCKAAALTALSSNKNVAPELFLPPMRENSATFVMDSSLTQDKKITNISFSSYVIPMISLSLLIINVFLTLALLIVFAAYRRRTIKETGADNPTTGAVMRSHATTVDVVTEGATSSATRSHISLTGVTEGATSSATRSHISLTGSSASYSELEVIPPSTPRPAPRDDPPPPYISCVR